MTPDGTLDPGTAGFLDRLPLWAGAAGLLLLAAALSRRLRTALAGAWQESAIGGPPSRWIPALALAAGALRLGLAQVSDIGLGDDGARVVWLERWLQDPEPIWSGLWAPGHLYAQALLWTVLRDTILAGVVLSALAATGTAWILGSRAASLWGQAGVGSQDGLENLRAWYQSQRDLQGDSEQALAAHKQPYQVRPSSFQALTAQLHHLTVPQAPL